MLPTLGPVVSPTAVATPFGTTALPQQMAVGSAVDLAFAPSTTAPWVLLGQGLEAPGFSTLVSGASFKAAGLLVVPTQTDVWVADAGGMDLAHLIQADPVLGGLGTAATFSIAATPSAMAADGSQTWIGTEDGDVLAVSGTSTASAPVGGDPTGIALTSTDAWISVATDSSSLMELNRSSMAIAGRFSVGTKPVGVAVDASGSVWVADGAATSPGSFNAFLLRSGSSSPQVLSVGSSAPTAIAVNASHAFVAVPDALVTFGLDGTPEATVSLPLTPDVLGIDALGRVWACETKLDECVVVWGQ